MILSGLFGSAPAQSTPPAFGSGFPAPPVFSFGAASPAEGGKLPSGLNPAVGIPGTETTRAELTPTGEAHKELPGSIERPGLVQLADGTQPSQERVVQGGSSGTDQPPTDAGGQKAPAVPAPDVALDAIGILANPITSDVRWHAYLVHEILLRLLLFREKMLRICEITLQEPG